MKTNNFNLRYNLLCLPAALFLNSCKAPVATVVEDKAKQEIPKNFNQEQTQTLPSSALTPWKQFFSDPQLVSLIETALKNNQDLMMTLQEIEIAKSDVLYKKGRLSPTVEAGGEIGMKKVGRYTSEGAGDAGTNMVGDKKVPDWLMNYHGGLSLDWEVDIWHKLRTEKEAAVAHYLATVEGKNFVLSSLIAEVANNYYELLALDNHLAVVKDYIKLQQKALEISKIQKQAAAGTELGVKKFEAELAKSKAEEYSLNQDILEKENTLNSLLGRYPQPIERNREAFMKLVPQTIYTGIPSELLANRPDIREAELELQSAKLDVEAARKEFYPSLNISAMLGLEAFKPTYLLKIPESLATGVVGSLAGPLINKSAIQAQFKTADAKQIQALYEYDKRIINAYLDITNLMGKIKNIDEYYKLKAEQSQDLDKATEVAHELFRNSRADYLEVLMNQRDALDAKLELIEAKSQQMNAVVDIYKGLGGGWK